MLNIISYEFVGKSMRALCSENVKFVDKMLNIISYEFVGKLPSKQLERVATNCRRIAKNTRILNIKKSNVGIPKVP